MSSLSNGGYMYSKITTGALIGIHAIPVTVEADIAAGLPAFSMVGSPGSEVRESRDRVWAALKNVGLPMPASHITINLSPADVRKEGTSYDLPIAISILQAMELLTPEETKDKLFVGELGLSGEIKPVRGVLPIVQSARENGIKECVVPIENAPEGSVVPDVLTRGASDIMSLYNYLKGEQGVSLPVFHTDTDKLLSESKDQVTFDFSEVSGQEDAKRAALISAAGFHSLLLTGPPGAGKTMISKRIPGIMPGMSIDECLEVTAVHSVAGMLPPGKALITSRTFQNPHHTLSKAAMMGGGSKPHPGAVSLAHRSVLFLDELPEFQRDIIDSLRQPLEEHRINIQRAAYSAEYPADFLLVCAMNPCPCGYYPDRNKCTCTEPMIRKYRGKVSGPILDRIDLCVQLNAVKINDIKQSRTGSGIGSLELRKKVERARKMQEERYKGTEIRFNSDLNSSETEKYCRLGEPESEFMSDIYEKLSLSARAYHRIIRVSRTIADLDGCAEISIPHLAEAASYRPSDDYWRR